MAAHNTIRMKAGDRIGGLTLCAFVRSDRYGQVWIVRCDCGRMLGPRHLGSLRNLAKHSRFGGPHCRSCAMQISHTIGHWKSTGTRALIARYGALQALAVHDLVLHPEPLAPAIDDLESAIAHGELLSPEDYE